jgi:hypothetical protein
MEILKGLTNLRVNEKDQIKFECTLNKQPKSVQWLKDGEPLSEDDPRIKFVNDGTKQFLIIDNAQLSDIGNYSIKVDDADSAATLKVKGNYFIKY